MARLKKIEIEIKRVLESLAEGARKRWRDEKKWPPNKEITIQIKDSLRDLGKQKGYLICGHERENPEWLFDVVWLKYNKANELINSILVVESELNENDIEIDWDFQKLLLARAEHRVMIFQKKSMNDIHLKMDNFEEQIRKFNGTRSGDRYLFAGLDWNQGEFEFRLFIP